ncbi:hypothetical protein ANANG_G00286700 [Anguilla anguilla]|uniref:Uncharacterized protein n=1 Tax=Anguilla anguilla TaxID=7936 RepID=A0A9D3LJC3_ANGAN|nr:hypothetical protein ANANG_G00286700 [Anguilla anguilla]
MKGHNKLMMRALYLLLPFPLLLAIPVSASHNSTAEPHNGSATVTVQGVTAGGVTDQLNAPITETEDYSAAQALALLDRETTNAIEHRDEGFERDFNSHNTTSGNSYITANVISGQATREDGAWYTTPPNLRTEESQNDMTGKTVSHNTYKMEWPTKSTSTTDPFPSNTELHNNSAVRDGDLNNTAIWADGANTSTMPPHTETDFNSTVTRTYRDSYPAVHEEHVTDSYPTVDKENVTDSYPTVHEENVTDSYPTVHEENVTDSYPTVDKENVTDSYPTVDKENVTDSYPTVHEENVTDSYPTVHEENVTDSYPTVDKENVTDSYPTVDKENVTDSYATVDKENVTDSYPAVQEENVTDSYPTVQEGNVTDSYPAVQEENVTDPYPTVQEGNVTDSYPTVQEGNVTDSYPAVQEGNVTDSYPAVQEENVTDSYPAVQEENVTDSYPTVQEGNVTDSYPTVQEGNVADSYPNVQEGNVTDSYPNVQEENVTDLCTNKNKTTQDKPSFPSAHRKLICFIILWVLGVTATVFLWVTVFLGVRLSIQRKRKRGGVDEEETRGAEQRGTSLWLRPTGTAEERAEFWYANGSCAAPGGTGPNERRERRTGEGDETRRKERETEDLWVQPKVTLAEITEFWYAHGKAKQDEDSEQL